MLRIGIVILAVLILYVFFHTLKHGLVENEPDPVMELDPDGKCSLCDRGEKPVYSPYDNEMVHVVKESGTQLPVADISCGRYKSWDHDFFHSNGDKNG